MQKYFQCLEAHYSNLIQSAFLTFNEVLKMKNIMGVYLIYSPNKSILYIGSTNKFDVRFGVDLKYESTHTFMKKLMKTNSFIDRSSAQDYIVSECKYKIQVCESKRESEALEHFAIWCLNPRFNK